MVKPSPKLYLEFTNNFLTVPCFAAYLDVTDSEAQSLITRSKVMWLSEDSRNRSFFTNNCVNLCDHYHGMKPENVVFFKKRHEQRLLSEHSA